MWKKWGKRVVPANISFHPHCGLILFRRAVIILMIIVSTGFPYALFGFISLFTPPLQYQFRIAFIFLHVSLDYSS